MWLFTAFQKHSCSLVLSFKSRVVCVGKQHFQSSFSNTGADDVHRLQDRWPRGIPGQQGNIFIHKNMRNETFPDMRRCIFKAMSEIIFFFQGNFPRWLLFTSFGTFSTYLLNYAACNFYFVLNLTNFFNLIHCNLSVIKLLFLVTWFICNHKLFHVMYWCNISVMYVNNLSVTKLLDFVEYNNKI